MTLEITPELEKIRAEADLLGIKYHHRAGVEKIKGLINAHIAGQAQANTQEALEQATPDVPQEKVEPMSAVEYHKSSLGDRKRKASKLIRVRIQCMNPAKREWPGEIISVGSAKLGTFKKYIPFNGEPYHIPKIIYDMLKEKKCSVFYSAPAGDGRGGKVRKSRLINEYAIEVLPPLTKDELSDLARQQAMAAGQGTV